MTDTIQFGVNDRVKWSYNIRGKIIHLSGVVALVVPPMQNPCRLMDKRFGHHRGLDIRLCSWSVRVKDHWSYIIQVDGMKDRKYRWPAVHLLRGEQDNG